MASMKDDATHFAEFDADGNAALDFEEFLAMQPTKIREAHSAEEIRMWFDSADSDGNGTLSINEFFVFSMRNASTKQGTRSIEACFAKHDKDGSGYLDAREFKKACTDMGFGAAAHSIFKELDHDRSGSVSYHELIETLQSTVPTNPDVKKLLNTMAWSTDTARKEEEEQRSIDTSGWRVRGKDAESVRREVREIFQKSGAHVIDLLKLFDQDCSDHMTIDDMEFHHAMRTHFGFRGNALILSEIFRSLDWDYTGEIGFDELFEFVRGYRHALDARSKRVGAMRIAVPAGASYTLDDVEWDVETLRILIQQTLARHRTTATELMAAWDKKGDGELFKGEFVGNISGFFRGHNTDLWEHELRAIAEAAFAQANSQIRRQDGLPDKNTGTVNMVGLGEWLDLPTDRPKGDQVRVKSSHALEQQAKRRAAQLEAKLKAERLEAAKKEALYKQTALGGVERFRQAIAAKLPKDVREAIEAAKAAANARKQMKANAEHQRRLQWWTSRGSQYNGQRFERPPLQRWEMPTELASSPKPALRTMGALSMERSSLPMLEEPLDQPATTALPAAGASTLGHSVSAPALARPLSDLRRLTPSARSRVATQLAPLALTGRRSQLPRARTPNRFVRYHQSIQFFAPSIKDPARATRRHDAPYNAFVGRYSASLR